MIPRATYRFQFHRDFPFARAEEMVPYLDRLGISHIYASPITTARSGSQHGYDVVDPTRVNPELGGEDALRSLVQALRASSMGLIIDIVPNHMGVAGGENAWWNDVLAQGQASPYARFFDIDWSKPLLLPILGAPLEEVLADGAIAVERGNGEPILTVYGEHRLPLRREDHGALPEAGDKVGLWGLLERQHYRLGWWRIADDELNWRRFFTINDLAGVRVEDDTVFEETHALYFRLWREGLIDGVRVDHIDGLTDPAAYCRRLRHRFAGEDRVAEAPQGKAYIVVEKILGAGEQLPEGWEIDGTSGYDFMEEVSALLHDPAGEAPLDALWQQFSGRSADFATEELRARQDMLARAFSGQLDGCVDAFATLAACAPETRAFSRAMLRRAIERLLWVFPVYRTYGTGGQAPDSDDEVRREVRHRVEQFIPPGETGAVDAVLQWLAGKGAGDGALKAEAVRRFQQLSAPIAAKAVEDTAFYRHGRLLSRTDVGFDAGQFASSVDAFHRACRQRATRFPHSMLTTATHDHKRGEDVRARLAVLSALPDLWRDNVTEWDRLAEGPDSGVDPADRYMLYQMLYGAWPNDLEAADTAGMEAYFARIGAWQEKALREAKLRSSWDEPAQDYERQADVFLSRIRIGHTSSDLLGQIRDLVTATQPAAQANSFVQVALRYTTPGVPDLYQGTELPDFSLVDPDNRTPVDFRLRQAMLAGASAKHPKLALTESLLAARRSNPDLFASGDYLPARITGKRAAHALAFSRRHGGVKLHCAFLLRASAALYGVEGTAPAADWWADTEIHFDGQAQAVPARLVLTDRPAYFLME